MKVKLSSKLSLPKVKTLLETYAFHNHHPEEGLTVIPMKVQQSSKRRGAIIPMKVKPSSFKP